MDYDNFFKEILHLIEEARYGHFPIIQEYDLELTSSELCEQVIDSLILMWLHLGNHIKAREELIRDVETLRYALRHQKATAIYLQHFVKETNKCTVNIKVTPRYRYKSDVKYQYHAEIISRARLLQSPGYTNFILDLRKSGIETKITYEGRKEPGEYVIDPESVDESKIDYYRPVSFGNNLLVLKLYRVREYAPREEWLVFSRTISLIKERFKDE